MRKVLVIEVTGLSCVARVFDLTIDTDTEIGFHNGEETEVIQLTDMTISSMTDAGLVLVGNVGEVEYYVDEEVNGAFDQLTKYNNSCEDKIPVDLIREMMLVTEDMTEGVTIDL